MLYLLQALSYWWLAAAALGLVIGFRARANAAAPVAGGWLQFTAFLVLLVALWSGGKFLPGRYGLWLETALLLVAAYAIGCSCGCLAGSAFRNRGALVGGGRAAPVPPPLAGLDAKAEEIAGLSGERAAGRELPEASSAPTGIAEPASEAEAIAVAAASPTACPPPREDRPGHLEFEDRLTQIEGVGETKKRKLQALGVWRFAQIAAWTPEQARWIGGELGDPGVVEEENWIGQAALLAHEGAKARPGLRPPEANRPDHAADEDDLRLIRGINLTISHELHEIGVWRFSQIAAWTPDHLEWIAHYLRQSPSSSAQFWPRQARLLASGALTDHARAILKGEAPPAEDDVTTLTAWMETLPRLVAPGAGDALYAGTRPPGLPEPAHGESDDLTRIEGIDCALAARLNGLGIWDCRQIAHWSQENARWIGAYLALPGAPERQNWRAQARAFSLDSTLSF